MSATVDERIVRMQFDNKDFEKNVSTSLSTLEKLKNALGFTKQKEELATLAKAVENTKFDGMVKSIDAIQERFSAFGIFGKRIIEGLADDFYNFTKNVISAIPNQIAQGGWGRALNVEQAKFTLKGLGVAWEQVADDIDHAVLGTAYGADEAAKAASQLAASGVAYGGVIGTMEDGTEVFSDMGRALRGISGVAAMTNSSYSEIANVFTTVAGQGKLMTQQLRMLESRGLNAAASMAKVFGTTEDEVRDMVTHGEIDFQLFADAMDIAFGEHATAANETFDGAMSNMKASLSRIGQDWAQVILQQTPQVFNSLKGFFNKIRTYTKPFADSIFAPVYSRGAEMLSKSIDSITKNLPDTLGFIKEFTDKRRTEVLNEIYLALDGIFNIFKAIGSVLKPIGEAFSEVFNPPTVDSIKGVGMGFKEMTEQLILTDSQAESLKETFIILFKILDDVGEVIKNIIYVISPLGKVFVSLMKSSIRIAGAFVNLFEKLRGGENASDKFKTSFETAHDTIEAFADILVNAIDKVTKLSTAFIETKMYNFIYSIEQAIDKVKKFEQRTGLLSSTLQFIGKVIATPIYLIGTLATKIYEFIKAAYQMPEVQNIISKIVDVFEDLGKRGYEQVLKFIDYISKADPKKFLLDLKDIIGKVWDKIKDIFNSLSERFEIVRKFKEEIDKLIENFRLLRGGVSAHTLYDEIDEPMSESTSTVHRLREAFEKVTIAIKDFFDKLDSEKIIAVSFTIAIMGMLIGVWKLINNFTELTTGVKDMVGSFTSVAKSISGFFKSWSKKEHSKIVEFATAIGILTAALIALALVKEHHDLWGAAAVLGAVSAGLLLITFALSKISKSLKAAESWKELATLDATMLAISASVLILAGAFKLLSEVNTTFTKALGTLGIIASLSAIMLGISFVLSKFSGKGLKGFLSLIAFAFVLRQFSKSLDEMSKINFFALKNNLATLTVVFLGMSALAIAASHVGVFSAVGLLAVVFTLDKIIPTIEKIAKTDMSNLTQAIRNNLDLIEVLGLIALAMLAVSGIFGKGLDKFGRGMILISISMLVMSKAIDSIGSISPNKIKQGTDVVTQMLLLFSILAAIDSIGRFGGGKSGMLKVAAAIGVFSLCLYPIAGAIWILGTMDSKKVEQGTKAVVALLACFGVITLLSSFGDKKSAASIIPLVIGVIALCAELVALTYIPTDRIISATVSIVSVMASFGVVLYAVSKLGKQEHPVMAIIQILTIAALLVEVGAVLKILSDQPWQNILGAAGSIFLVLSSMALTFEVLSISKAQLSSVGGFLLLALSLIPVGLALYELSKQPWKNMLGAAVSISAVLLSFTAAAAILQLVNPASAIMGALGFMGVVTIIIALAGALGALAELIPDSWMKWIISGLDRLILIAEKFGEVIGAFIGGAIGSGALYSLIGIAAGLTAFSEISDPFFKWVKELSNDNSIVSGSLKLLETMALFSAGSLLSGLTLSPLFGSVTANAMRYMGDGIKSFADSVRGLDVSDIQPAIDIASKLFSIRIPNSGGIVSWFTGDNKIEKFNSKVLGEFGEGLKAFTDKVSGIEGSSTDSALYVANKLFELDPKNQGGIVSWFTGDNKLKSFNSKYLGTFGGGLKAFANEVSGIESGSTDAAIEVANKLFELDPKNQGGIVSWFTGDNKLSKFNLDVLGSFGGGLKAFANKVSGIKTGDADAAIEVANKLFELDPKNQGGIVSWFTGDNKLSNFNLDTLGAFGEGIKAFVVSVSDLGTSALENATLAAQVLDILDNVNIQKRGGLMGILSFFAGGSDSKALSDFISKFKSFGDAVYAFYSSVSSIDPAKLSSATDSLDYIYSILKDIDNFGDSNLSAFVQAMQSAGDLGVEAFCNALMNAKSQIDIATSTFMSNAADSVTSNQGEFTSSADSMSDAFISQLTGESGFDMGGSITGNSKVADKLGLSFDSSFADGLKNYQGLITDSTGAISDSMLGEWMDKFDMANLNGESGVASGFANVFDTSYADQLIDPNNIRLLTDNVTTLGTNIQNAWTTGPASVENATNDAKNTIKGYVNGLGDEEIKQSGIDKIKSFADSIRQGWRNFWDQRSPSKLAAEDADYTVQGYALGLSQNAYKVADAMNTVNDAAYDSMKTATNSMANYVAENMDLNPLITPELDITGIQSEAQTLADIFNKNKEFTLNGRIGNMTDALDSMNLNATKGDADIVSAINSLNEEVRTLYGVVGNLQIIMDSETLVGAIAPGMDNALGKMAAYKRRGI